MDFLTQPDYFTFIKEVALQQVIENNQNYVVTCEAAAQEEISMALSQRYDVDAIFSATGTARNPIIVSYMVCITLYLLMMRVNQELPPKYENWYNSVKATLLQIAEGTMNPNLPRLEDDDDEEVMGWVIGSNDKTEDKW